MINYLTECTITVISILAVLMKEVSGQIGLFAVVVVKMTIKRKNQMKMAFFF